MTGIHCATCTCTPTPYALWKQAEAEHPHDGDARRDRYVALMREHGHIVQAKPGEDRNLPCGWPGLRVGG